MDAISGYKQIRMAEEDQEKIAFIMSQGLYCYKVMPFGLKNAGLRIKASGKFLGFIVSQRGIEANPEKVRPIINMASPKNVKEVQKLMGRIAALNSPPLLSPSKEGENLYLYLAVSASVVSAALIREEDAKQLPVYYVNQAFQGAKSRYPRIEKITFALIVASRKLRQYFQANPILVITDQPIKKSMNKPKAARRMVQWAIELSQFDIEYHPRTTIKAQALADFIAKFTLPDEDSPPNGVNRWTLQTDGSSAQRKGGVGVVITTPDGEVLKYGVQLKFPATNNEAEYEGILTGLRLGKVLGVKNLLIQNYSKLVIEQIRGEHEAKEERMQKYLRLMKHLTQEFDTMEFVQIPRSQNMGADEISKIASSEK
ncbi:uncharacterized protein LOC115950318 [Quercus lobata]|uniref:uncharacterized protein LOC115950318 n=1 Tax=Quercus lobata TaxID=97700 RepID=UPI0012457264|nr:uncharacterized protein LOC115950318 [Quercus lobata]